MDEKKIAIIIHKTDENFFSGLLESLEQLEVPEGYDAEVLPVEGEEKFFAYDYAMNQSDAKYKIYIDEKISVRQKNILSDLLKIFQADEKIGVIGTSGAIEISTHGICFDSAKRCGKIFLGANKVAKDWGGVEKDFREVESADEFFIATQKDISWRQDLFKKSFGVSAQCSEFRRQGYKCVVAKQKKPALWLREEKFFYDEQDRNNFLDEYSGEIFPLVSVVIPTYNRPKYFQIALESALNQTYRHLEIFVSDNSPNDKTEKLIQPYLEKDSRIKYFRHKNFSANDNWNFARAYNNPDAEFVNWLMDDDKFYPRKIEKMVEIFRNNPDVSIVSSVRDNMDANGKITGRIENPHEILNRTLKLKGEEAFKIMFDTGKNFIGEPTTALLRKKCLRDNDLCRAEDETGFFALIDMSTWCQLLSEGNLFWIGDESLSAFRNHDEQATNWSGSGAFFEVSRAKLLQNEWQKKFFIKTEYEIRERILQWIYTASLRLMNAHMNRYTGPEIKTLEQTLIAMSKALANGYKIELPPRDYGEKTKSGRIS